MKPINCIHSYVDADIINEAMIAVTMCHTTHGEEYCGLEYHYGSKKECSGYKEIIPRKILNDNE